MLTDEDIMHLCGELPDWKIAQILTSDATYEDLMLGSLSGCSSE
jgi:hypothetical protein